MFLRVIFVTYISHDSQCCVQYMQDLLRLSSPDLNSQMEIIGKGGTRALCTRDRNCAWASQLQYRILVRTVNLNINASNKDQIWWEGEEIDHIDHLTQVNM